MSALPREIRREIERNGPISFARFMQLALYAPGLGYYEQPRTIGRRGDFLTSVCTGPLFGQLLAFQFSEWLTADCPTREFRLIEAGAHDGRLAVDILDWLSHFRPELLSRLRYLIIEPSHTRQSWQETTLRAHNSIVTWLPNLETLAPRQLDGIIFSNEFFDALPVHRMAWSAHELCWKEWHVACKEESFAWHLGLPAPNLPLPPVPPELAAVLPDGFIAEISPAAVDWWRVAAQRLRRGRLLTIDYGFSSSEPLRPDRPNGTLRAYFRHHPAADLLANPGDQDLTADVNFSALENAGRTEGLSAGVLVRQSRFLTEVLAKTQTNPESFAPWNEKALRQFQTLTHPEHFGHPFHFLIQKCPGPV